MMKKLRMVTALLLCMMLVGCNNEFAKTQYDAENLIVKEEDRYTKNMSVLNHTGTGLTLTVGDFDGRETIWTENYSEAQVVEMDIRFTIRGGKAKLIHIDSEDQIHTMIECTAESGVSKMTTFSVPVTKGRNRWKVVGYECKDIDLEIAIK
ncbi:MAG: hypothetical protein PUD20_09425 [bacterium]|nr:hypothetical protein [bacterium]